MRIAENSVQAVMMPDRERAKLVDGARQFEGMMLQEMLKPLHFGEAEAAEDGSGGGAGDTIRGFATEAFAKAIAAKGGFGIAEQIVRQVEAERDGHGTGAA